MKTLADALQVEPEDKKFQDDVRSWITEQWRKLKGCYNIYALRCWEARLFYAGESWIEKDLAPLGFWKPVTPRDEWVPMPQINEFAPAVDSIASNFHLVPEVECSPVPKDDEAAMVVADVANKLIEHCIKDTSLKSDYKSDEDKAGYAAQEFVLSGDVFSLVYPIDEVMGQKPVMEEVPGFAFHCPNCDIWVPDQLQAPESCPQCGGPIQVEARPIQQPQIGEDGQPVTTPITQKKIIVEIGDPTHFFPRPGARNMGESEYILRAHRMSLNEIYSRWQYEAKPNGDQPDAFGVTYQNALMYWYQGYNSSSTDYQDGALVIEGFMLPGKSRDYPDGFYAVMVNEEVIHCEPWPFCDQPVTKGDYMQMPGIFFARSVSFDLIPLQRELNRYESAIALHAMTSAVDTLCVDDDALVTQVTGRADKVVHVRAMSGNPQNSVWRLQHGKLDEGIYRKREQILESFQRISATVAVFRGEQPGSVTAASAIAQLRGQAELQFAKPVQNWNNFWKETIRKAVKNYQKYYTSAQLTAIVGIDKTDQVKLFIKADLDTCTTYVATSSGLPKTRDERRQEMLVLYDKGALDVNDPNVKSKLFELFGETGMMKTFNDDARRARVNVRSMKSGRMAIFRQGIDDPDVHLGIALEAAKSLEFDNWPPIAQAMLLKYIADIQGQLQMAADMEMQKQMALNQKAAPNAGGSAENKPQPAAG
jgi:hypothetical protein